jgi:hypothetical protein
MVQAILADNNIQGHVAGLIAILESDSWREFWFPLNLRLRTFRELELPDTVSDAQLWHLCQEQQIILLTANRNADGPESLEVMLRTCNKPESLPVFTIADPERVLHSKKHAERVAARLLDYLLVIDSVRGTGRLYLP